MAPGPITAQILVALTQPICPDALLVPCCCAGLFFPEAFLIAVLQSHALQSKGTAIDRLSLAHVVLSAAPGPSSISKPPSVGVYIHGLHLEGARWGLCAAQGELSPHLSCWGQLPCIICSMPCGQSSRHAFVPSF